MSTVSAQLALIEERVHAAQGKGGRLYWVLLACAIGATGIGAYSWSRIIRFGMGETGLNRPVAWGVLITDFVFWVGIAHSGTLISAILFLFRARFRTAVYRVAEAMTVFAVATAGLFPIIHLGRPWFGYWILPYPNERSLWINFRSPLVWDAFAISTYLVVSSLFLLSGLVPDAAALRDATSGWRRRLYAMVSLGWRGTDEEWRHHSRAYLFFAAFATPLVISVHSVVSWDFAVSVVPGWHSTLFPPYFVAGAILSGVAMVLTLLVPLRRALGIEELVTRRHLDLLSRLVLLTSLIVTFSYGMEFVLALWRGPRVELETLLFRAFGSYAPLFWTMVFCNCAAPLLLFFPRIRNTPIALFFLGIVVNVGMWLERFNIVVTSLSHNRIPFDWGTYRPSLVELGITLGSFGWFFTWFLVFLKLLPAVSIAELKEEVGHPHEGVDATEVAHAA
ncbi:MAG: hydrogenase [Deltaproteobacteria bacterium]|nr:MAG: hydrogenase [Deltaproteobacteria bacterium]